MSKCKKCGKESNWLNKEGLCFECYRKSNIVYKERKETGYIEFEG
jgi:NMD protein affecting ribosome stability and mRNA decay